MSFFDSMFGGGGEHVDMAPITAAYNQRLSQIGDFSNQLAAQRTQYQNQYNQFAQQQFLTQLMPNMAAQFASHGLQTNGGAFGAELARQAAGLQGRMLDTNFAAGQNNAMAVNSAYGQAYGTYAPQLMQGQMYNAQIDTQNQQAMGHLFGTLAGAGLAAGVGGNPAASFGQNFFSNLGYTGFGYNPFTGGYSGGKLGLDSGYGGGDLGAYVSGGYDANTPLYKSSFP